MRSRNGMSCRVIARQARLALLVALPLLAVGPRAWAADLTTREVVSALFKAAPGSAPDLSGKDLRRLDLAGVDFKGANLARATLFGSDLAGANLAKANLAGAVLDRVTITKTNFADADLSQATILRPNIFSGSLLSWSKTTRRLPRCWAKCFQPGPTT